VCLELVTILSQQKIGIRLVYRVKGVFVLLVLDITSQGQSQMGCSAARILGIYFPASTHLLSRNWSQTTVQNARTF